MKYGYARVSTDGQSIDAQVRQLTKAGCKKVFRETASGAKTDRAELRKALATLDDGDVLMVTRLDRPGAIHTRPPEHPGIDYRQAGRVPVLGRHMGRHHHVTWSADADRARRAC
jgi:hypothetical protein